MPTPTEAPPAASRIAFDFTARQARHANARSASVAASAAVPGLELPPGRVVARLVDPVPRLREQPAADRPKFKIG